MMNLLRIEFQKILTYKTFWFMIGFYSLILAFMIFGIPGLIDYVAEKTGETSKLRIFKALVFNFPDIWQNISFIAGIRYFIKIILGIVVIILVTTEYQFSTIRTNIINGLSRNDFLAGKIEIIVFLSIFSTLILFLSGLYLGFVHSASKAFLDITGKLSYLGGYFLELSSYLLFCLFLGILLRKTGLAFIAHFIYFIIEPILDYKLNDQLAAFLPLNVINSVVRTPNTSLIKVKSPGFDYQFQEAILLSDVGLCLAYGLIFIFLSWLILKKRDI
jgi:ABC-type transport system involved in multi-copper enzyme maturation permease subunit